MAAPAANRLLGLGLLPELLDLRALPINLALLRSELRSGLPLKTIGDLLGHRTFESTCVYLRLATDDLRDVPLNLPTGACTTGEHEAAR